MKNNKKMKKAEFSIWFKNYQDQWVQWGLKFTSKGEAAQRALKYVKKNFALNGRADIFENCFSMP